MRRNPNVPKGVKILEEYSCLGGEIIYTVYEQAGKKYKVGDWKWDRPVEIKEEEKEVKKMIKLVNAFSINMLKEDDSKVRFKRISLDEAKDILRQGFESFVGHQDLANIAAGMLEMPVQVNKVSTMLEKDDIMIVAQFIGPRLPEGATKLPDGARVDFFKVTLE